MKLKRGVLATILAVALTMLMVPVGVFAATNWSVVKSGRYYIVDGVKSETTVDGVLIQTIERRFVPEDRYNPNSPNVPNSSGNGYWDNNGNYIDSGRNDSCNQQNRAQRLKDAGYNSSNAIVNYAKKHNWTYSAHENYSRDNEFSQYLYFRFDNAKNYDYVDIDFTEQVVFDQNGNPFIRYYNKGVAYTEADLRAMFDKSY